MAISQVAQLDLENNFERPLQVSVTSGTAPLKIASTTVVSNLNADLLDGKHASAFSLTSHNHNRVYHDGSHYATVSAGGLRIQTDTGWVDIGSDSGSYCHYETDRPAHWFNKEMRVQGEIYAGPSYNQRVYHTGYKPTKADVGLSSIPNSISSSVSSSSNGSLATSAAAKTAYDKGVQALNTANDAYSKANGALKGYKAVRVGVLDNDVIYSRNGAGFLHLSSSGTSANTSIKRILVDGVEICSMDSLYNGASFDVHYTKSILVEGASYGGILKISDNAQI